MGAWVRVLSVSLPLLLALPGVSAQAHEHEAGAGIAIAHDVPADGQAFAGTPNHFALVVHGDDAVPDFHLDVPYRVSLDGEVLVETTADSGHDYDGINAFDVVFPSEGTYLVEALGASGETLASFGGTVGPRAGKGLMDVVASDVGAGRPTVFEVHIYDAGGLAAHTDATFEVWQEGALQFRTKAHTHHEPMVLSYTFPAPGDYQVRVVGFQAYPSPGALRFDPAVVEMDLAVGPGAPQPAVALPVPPPADLNAVVEGSSDGPYRLLGTYDPYTVVGPSTLQHLSALVVDEDGAPVPHVDFTASLRGPSGAVFGSDTLHEYDGIYEVATRQAVPGLYILTAEASTGDWTGSLEMAYTVAPPVVPTSAGPVALAVSAAEATAGDPAGLEFAATAATGPFAHSEIEVRARQADAAIPWFAGKLHTHDDGRFPLLLAFPTEGTHVLEADPFPLMPEAVLAAPAVFQVQVAAASAPTTLAGEPEDRAEDLPLPFLAAPLALATALALALRRRA